MYLLASDFDNTLYINNNDFKNNILKIKEFINDNVFVIATGRSYEDFDNLTKGSVLFNYLIINHGARPFFIQEGERFAQLIDFEVKGGSESYNGDYQEPIEGGK